MKDICNFIPAQSTKPDIEFIHFVYEASYKRLVQPFMHANFYMHLAFKGTATLKINGKTHTLEPGTLFFTFPQQAYEIEGKENFTYLYISFNGFRVPEFLSRFHVDEENYVFQGLESLPEFWMSAAQRINAQNAIALTESVFLYSLSFTTTPEQNGLQAADRFDSLLDYIGNNYANPDLSILLVADMFFYSKKYLSTLFIKRTGVKFTDYLNNLRIQRAQQLLQNPSASVSEVAARCGFGDPLYFSKVFKKSVGLTPSAFKKQL